ncbi:MAG: DNA double-strand break repair nuclease NurA [Promethearchaeota archaeon]
MSRIRSPWELDNVLQKIADQVHNLEEKRSAFTSVLHATRFELDLLTELPLAHKNLLESQLASKVASLDLGGLRICGVDGGLLKKSLRGLELVISRAIATIFEYDPSGRVSAKYWPEQGALPRVKANLYPISRREAEISASLERVKDELQIAIQVQDRHPSELLLLDGSILPQITDQPSPRSTLVAKHKKIRSLYNDLYTKVEETGTLLAGIVKDSRSNRFMNLLGELLPHLMQRYPQLSALQDCDYRSALKSIYDSEFFFRVLEPGERSCIFRLEEGSLSELKARAKRQPTSKRTFVGFFTRTAKYDYPLRVEVLVPKHFNPKEVVTKVSSMLSSDTDTFALPTVLIEADSQARLAERDMDFIFTQLAHRIGHPANFMKQRRERMPFH